MEVCISEPLSLKVYILVLDTVSIIVKRPWLEEFLLMKGRRLLYGRRKD